MNSVSSSLSVYHGPPVSSVAGCRLASMYVLRVGCYTSGFLSSWFGRKRTRNVPVRRGRS